MTLHRGVLILGAALGVACGGADTEDSVADRAGEVIADSASADSSVTVVLTVPSMSCPLCAGSIEGRLKEAGVRDVRVDLDAKRVTAAYDPSRITAEEVAALVEGQGFPVTESRRVDGAGEEVEP